MRLLQNQGVLFNTPDLVVRECPSPSSLKINIRQVAKDHVNIIMFNPHSSFMKLRYSY